MGRFTEPHIFPQGSFRLGTAIRPLDAREEYDLDLACKLRIGITKELHSQAQLKKLVGDELKAYRKANNIQDFVEEKKRCWRLNYQGAPHFHMDIVPCIPADNNRKNMVMDSLKSSVFANDSRETWLNYVSITDNTRSDYHVLSDDWNSSNPLGYALWFERRMMVTSKIRTEDKALVVPLPLFAQKTPLQQVIQLLKRHRDVWPNATTQDSKPISIIITTLAAMAYGGESDIGGALVNILNRMESFVNAYTPRVPNPVNPKEDFADRWDTDKGKALQLKENFFAWLEQAKRDFGGIGPYLSAQNLQIILQNKFNVTLSGGTLAGILNNTHFKIVPTISEKTSNIPILPSHVKLPMWPLVLSARVRISGTIKNGIAWDGFVSGQRIPKYRKLIFRADTDVAVPFDVYWQVVNTGEEASRAACLRGEIEKASSAGKGGLVRNERTLYTGDHWVECFIIKSGECVARSGKFYVNIG